MTHRDMIIKAEERTIIVNARWARFQSSLDRDEDEIVERMKELVEAK